MIMENTGLFATVLETCACEKLRGQLTLTLANARLLSDSVKRKHHKQTNWKIRVLKIWIP